MRTAHIICLLIVFICIASAGCALKENTVAATNSNPPATIAPSNIKSLEITPIVAGGTVYSTIDFTAKAYNENGQSVPVTWSIGSGRGSISSNGVLTPTGTGEIIVVAMAGNVAKTATANIESEHSYDNSHQCHNSVQIYTSRSNNNYDRHYRNNNNDNKKSISEEIDDEVCRLCSEEHDHGTSCSEIHCK